MFGAIFRAEGDTGRAGAQIEQIAVGDGEAGDLFGHGADILDRDRDEGGGFAADIAFAEDVQRDAAIAGVRTDQIAVAVIGGLERLLHAAARYVAGLGFDLLGARIAVIAVIVPVAGNLALGTDQGAIGGVVDIGDAGADLVEAAIDGGGGIAIAIGVRGRQQRLRFRRKEGGVDVERDRAGERRGREAVLHPVVDELTLGIDGQVIVDVIMGLGAQQDALLGHLQIIVRRIVVGVGRRVIGRIAAVLIELILGAGQGEAGAGDRARAAGGQAAIAVIGIGLLGVAAGRLLDGVALGVIDVEGGVAATVGEIATHQQVGVESAAVAGLVDAIIGVCFHAGKVALGHEVDDAGDRVRTIDGGTAARHDFDMIDQARRNGVEIDDLVGVIGDVATAIDQHQGAVGAQAAQVGRGHAAARIVGCRRRAGDQLGQVVDNRFDVDLAAELQFLRADDRDRRCLLQVGAGDARTGDDDGVAGRAIIRRAGLREGRGRQAEQDGRRRKAPHDVRRHENNLPWDILSRSAPCWFCPWDDASRWRDLYACDEVRQRDLPCFTKV